MLDRLERVGEVSGSAIERGGEKKGRKSEKHEWYKFDDIVNDGHNEETSLRPVQTRHLDGSS